MARTLLQVRSSKAFLVFAVCFAISTIVPFAPTALQEKAGLPLEDVPRWTSILLTLYGAANTVVSPGCGYITDRVQSRQRPFLMGLLTLAAATALLCVGKHISLWIIGRLLQGASAAVVSTVGIAMLVDNFDGEAALGQTLGYVAMATIVGTTAGPLLGGVLYEHGGYYAPFGLAFGLLVLDFIFRLAMVDSRAIVEHSNSGHPSTSDEASWTDKSIIDKKQTVVESRVSEPLHDNCRSRGSTLILLRSPRMLTALLVYLIISTSMTSFDSVLPLFVHDTFAWAQTAQGLIFISLMAPQVMSPLYGYTIDRWPRLRRYQAAVALLSAVPILVCFRYVSQNTLQDKVLLCALLTLLGTCFAILEPPIMVEMSCIVEELQSQHPGIFGKGGATAFAYGLSNCAFAVGAMAGPFLGGWVWDAYGWATMGWVLALPLGASSLLVLSFFR
ncbi:major facilitator superfamily domain-containing protein [Aspergillus novoparasiticus]|uniref:Major facilitator superfamily domain-containing protein n=1 Tax=Aspergillus novoparasiticus TaxID=986946 RepID=A0A5N6EE46_9EURO|nr:major facilitator superfamily domain-containing protein [Aspergillus novoparasiticus]